MRVRVHPFELHPSLICMTENPAAVSHKPRAPSFRLFSGLLAGSREPALARVILAPHRFSVEFCMPEKTFAQAAALALTLTAATLTAQAPPATLTIHADQTLHA